MNIQIQKTSSTEAVINVTVSAADYQPGLKVRLRNYSQKARLPGFRVGHVPMEHIQRLYGQSLLLEELNALLQKSLSEYITKEQLKTLGEPILEKADPLGSPEELRDYHFNYQLGLQAEVSLTGIEKISLIRYNIIPEEKDFKELIENIQYRFGTTVHPKQVEEPEVLLAGQLQVKADQQEELLLPRASMVPEQRARFAGLAPQDSLQIQPAALYTPATQPATLQKLQKQGLNLHTHYTFLLQRIDKVEKAPLDQTLFDKMYGPGHIKDPADFMQRNRSYLRQQYKTESRRFLHTHIKELLVKELGPPLPEAYLKKRFELNLPKDQEIDEKTFQSSFTRYKDELKWRMLQAYLSEKHQLSVPPEALRTEVEHILLRQAQVYDTPTEEQRQDIQPFVQKFLSNKRNTESIYVQMQEEKVLSFLETQLKLKEEEITPTAFHKLAQERNAAP